MGFPTIPTVAAGRVLFANQADTTATRTFPAFSGLTYSDGDLLLAIVTTYQSTTNPQFSSWSNGFTELSAGGDQGSATTMGVGIAYKIASGTEAGSLTVTQAATITGHASMCLLAIPLAHASTAPEAGTIANGTSAAADPGSFNPAGWGTEDTLWISVAVSGMTSGTGSWTATGTAAPTSYTDRADSNTTDNSTVGQTEIAVAFRQLNAASEDVGTAGVDLSNARNSALVIAVRPAPVTHAATGALTGPGAVVAGSASSATARPSSGALVGPGAVVAGAAARTRVHATDGALVGPGAAVVGSADRQDAGGPVTHAATGALVGPGTVVAGTAARTRVHATDGALVGPGAVVAGAASSATVRASSGALVGPGAVVAGTAARVGAPVSHAATGILIGPGAIIVGAAGRPADTSQAGFDIPRDRIPVHHSATGRLVGRGASLHASARITRTGQNPLALLLISA